MDADPKTLELDKDAPRRSMHALVLHSSVTLFLGDCMEILPTLELGVIITDPPYGMKKADWDEEIPNWLPLAGTSPVATYRRGERWRSAILSTVLLAIFL